MVSETSILVMGQVALPDDGWARVQDGFGRLHALLGSIDFTQQQLAAQLVRTSRLLNQAARGQQLMVKQLESIGQAAARLSSSPRLRETDGLELSPPKRCRGGLILETPTTPWSWRPGKENVLGAAAGGMPTSCSTVYLTQNCGDIMVCGDGSYLVQQHGVVVPDASQVCVEMSKEVNADHTLDGWPRVKEMCTQCSPDVQQGSVHPVFSEMGYKVTWDEEMQSDIEMHEGLLKQLAQGGDFFVGKKNNQLTDDLQTHVVVPKHVEFVDPMTSKGFAHESVFNEMPPEMVIWDEHLSADLDAFRGLLQESTDFGEYLSSEENKPSVELVIKDVLSQDSSSLFLLGVVYQESNEMHLQDDHAAMTKHVDSMSPVTSLGEAETMLDELTSNNALWDEWSQDLDYSCGLLQNQLCCVDATDGDKASLVAKQVTQSMLSERPFKDDTHHSKQSAYLVDEDSKSINESVIGDMLTQENYSSFILDAGINVMDSMFVGMALEEANAIVHADPAMFRDSMERNHDACELFCEIPNEILWDDIPSYIETHGNLLQLVMGTEDLKDEKLSSISYGKMFISVM